MTSDAVVYTVTDGVADVRMNRPDKLNAVNQAMFAGLGDVGDELAANPSVRAIVLSGEGRGFCAGLDFSSFQSIAGGDGLGADDDGQRVAPARRGEDGIANSGQYAAYVWTQLPVPVIAAVHGPAVGAGFQIAMACDIRVVAPDAKLSVLEIRWGLIPDMTGTQMLPRLVGLDVAKELTFTGRMVSGTEANELGLATYVSDNPREDALALAGEIASKNPYAIRGAKKLLNNAGQWSLAEGLKTEERIMGSLIGSPNNVEAVTAYFEKRDPKFADYEPS